MRIGGWEITLAFDVSKCRILCAYRRTPDLLGQTPSIGLLSPPVIAIRVDSGAASTTLILDPAGIGSPQAAARHESPQEIFCAAGPKLYTSCLVAKRDAVATNPQEPRSLSLTFHSETTFPESLPLRI